LSSVSISSSNSTNTLAKAGDTVTVSFTSNEEIQTPTVQISEEEADNINNTSDNNWEATRTMTSEDEEGVVSFTIDFVDLAGNSGDEVAEVTDGGGSVTFDKTAPTVEITSPNADERVNGSTPVELTITEDNQDITECSVNSSDFVSCSSGVSMTAITGFDALSQGEFTLTVRHTDEAGNVGDSDIDLVKDSIAPTVEDHTPGINAVNVEGDTITIQFSEAVNATVSQITLNPNESFAISGSETDSITLTTDDSLDSNTTYTATVTTDVTDLAGNNLEEEYEWSFTTATLYDISLVSDKGGWNLISLPIVPNDTDISTVLGDAEDDIDVVWTYDPDNINADDSGWLVYNGDSETSNLDKMTAGYGYWMSVTSDTNISGSGGLLTAGPTTPPSRNLINGWNLIGYYQIPGEDSSTKEEAFSSIGTAGVDYTSLWGFDNDNGGFESVDTINPGDAFWISLPEEKSYTPSNLSSR
jgi:hypothetical protein